MNAIVRGYLEMAESAHPGPMRDYHAQVQAYADELKALVGRDEHACHVCGLPNYPRTGKTFWGYRGTYFCDDHSAEFDAYVKQVQEQA